MNIPFRATPTSVNLMLNGKTYTITKDSHQHYDQIREALKVKDFDTVSALIDIPKAINTFGEGKIKVVDGVVMYGEFELHNTLTKRILEQMQEGFDVQPMIKFCENLMNNPSKRAVDELFDFLEACDLPITDDGHFIAYKKIKHNYKDIYTGKMDNSVGKILTMPRNMVDEEKSRTCSAGLHFCSESYLPHYGSMNPDQVRVVLVKINPADVVAIPADYQNAKGRTCRYEVIDEVPVDKLNLKFTSSVFTTTTSDEAIRASDFEYTVLATFHDGGKLKAEEGFDNYDDAVEAAEDMLDYDNAYRVAVEARDGSFVFDKVNPNFFDEEEFFGEEQDEEDDVAPTPDTATTYAPKSAWPFPIQPNPVPTPVTPAPAAAPATALNTQLFTKAQLASILFGNGSLVHMIDSMIQDGRVEVVRSENATTSDVKLMYRVKK